jgi:putative tryptophan/tyrosine transport system substrate-binding protein
MNRRAFLSALASLFATPLAIAQQAASMRHIGFLGTAYASGYVRELEWVRGGLRKFGYVEGKNITVEYRWAESNAARLKEMATDLARLKVDVIVTHSIPGASAARQATSTIPIVMADGADPVAAGLATSLARPGGNVTGSMSFVPEESGKRLQLLKEALPRIERVAFLASSLNPKTFSLVKKAIAEAAASLKIELQEFVVHTATDLPEAFNAIGAARMDAAVISNEPLLNSQVGVIAGLASIKRLPTIGFVSFADAGGLLAYGANRPALYGRAAYFVDQIFKGAKPADIPFERATKFEVIVNLRTAKALGIAIPRSMLLRADRVIE